MTNAAPVAQGETIAGKYKVEKILGEGGMGVVVAAWHIGLQQRVAIKFLHSEVAQELDGAQERFRREARAAARIRSEHVCRVLDVGTLDNGTAFIVMEYMEGCDLSQELVNAGRPTLTESVEYILQACEALAEAHVAGIVHRDLKPANLFLAQRPGGSRAIKVLDFGISKSTSDSSISHLSLTRTSSLVGSPIYMSPEQIESSKDVDARADIWALGTILYELSTGRTPFDGESIAQLVNAVLNTEPPTFAALGVQAPPGFEDVVRRALTKNREQRYASVGELATALEPFAPHASASVTRVTRVLTPAGGSTPRPTIGATSQEVSAPFRTSARRGRYAAGLLLLLLPVVAAVLYAIYGRSDKAPALAPTGEHVVRAAQETHQAAATTAATPHVVVAPESGAAPRAAEPLPTPVTPVPVALPSQPAPTAVAPREAAPSHKPEERRAPSAGVTSNAKPGISDFGGRR